MINIKNIYAYLYIFLISGLLILCINPKLTETFLSTRKLSVLGPFNSGTNLMRKIIDNNPDSCKITYPFWKHTFKLNHLDFNIQYIVMYRHPYLWINSLKKAPYDITFTTIDNNVNFSLYRNVPTEKTEEFNLSFSSLMSRNSSFISGKD